MGPPRDVPIDAAAERVAIIPTVAVEGDAKGENATISPGTGRARLMRAPRASSSPPTSIHQDRAKVLALFSNPEIEIGTLVQKIKNEEELSNPNVVKVTRTISGQALYFSRSPIPYIRDKAGTYSGFVKHIGIYAYRTSVLNKIVKLAPSSLELAESLEQLRWLENGYKIFVAETDYTMLAVDTPEDLIKAEEFLNTLN